MPRIKACLVAIAVALLAVVPLAAQKRAPVPSDEEQRRLLSEGNEFHDNQDAEAAIARYQHVLQLNADNVDAMFELSTTYFEKGDYAIGLETALKGTEYRSDHLGGFYVIAGTCHDALGRPREAEAAYREGIRYDSTNFLLYYNLGVTCMARKRFDDAAASFRSALLLNPNHAGSHIGYAQACGARGERIAAFLAYTRALVLEAGSSRSERAVQIIGELLRTTPEPAWMGRKGHAAALKAEPMFASAWHYIDSLPLLAPAEITFNELTVRLGGLLRSASGARADAGTRAGAEPPFAVAYYVPYYRALLDRGYIAPLACHVFQTLPLEDLAAWRRHNEGRLDEFLEFSRSSRWTASTK